MGGGHNLFSLQKRIVTLLLVFAFLFCVIFLRLGVVQIINGAWLQNKAEDQWTRSLPIIAERGKILDTNGAVLAKSLSSYSLYTRAKEIKEPSLVAEFLASTLKLNFSDVYKKITNKSVSEVLIALQVNNDDALKIFEKDFDGVYLTENITRSYPYGDLLTQVLGFVTIDNIGQAGIEAYFNEQLAGKSGYSLVQSDLTGVSLENMLDYYIDATAGNTISLTIDANLQLIVEKVLNLVMQEQKAKSVSCIVMNAKNGEILAMSNKPSFDLNNVPRDDVSFLMETVKNKTVVDVYEPGSTFKIITMSIALELGVAQLTDRFYCPGYVIVDGEKIKCWKSIGHGSQSLAEGLANSCNCVFTTLAQRIGLERFYQYLNIFGFGTPTGIEISGESGGILMNKNLVKTVDLARMGFGQAVAVTPLQQITAIASAVNGGNLLTPHIVKNLTNKDNEIISSYQSTVKRTTISSNVSSIINDMLNLTVSKQTGEYTFVPGYAVGGKTGTTQKYDETGIAGGKYVSSFVGTYPVNNPQYILLLAVDEPGTGAYFGSVVASPYAKMIFQEMFNLYGIKPDDPSITSQTFQPFEMPNLVGLSLTQAINKLNEMKLAYEIDGSGGKVVSQIPVAKANAYPTDTIIIST